jgi:hypothetical protein
MAKKMSDFDKKMKQHYESLGDPCDHVEPGLPTGLKVSIYRLNGKSRSVSTVATGKFDAASKTWKFDGSESEIVSWLESNFNKGGAKNSGGVHMGINSIEYLRYLRDTLMPRKNLVMEWKY